MTQQLLLFPLEECPTPKALPSKSTVPAAIALPPAQPNSDSACKRFVGSYLAKPSEWPRVVAYMQEFVVPYNAPSREPATGQYIDCVERIPHFGKRNKKYVAFLKHFGPSVDDLNPKEGVTLQGRSVLEWHTFLGSAPYKDSEFFQGLLEAYRLDWKKLLQRQTFDFARKMVEEIEIAEDSDALQAEIELQQTIEDLRQQIAAQAEEIARLQEENATLQKKVNDLEMEIEAAPTPKTALSAKGKLALMSIIMGSYYHHVMQHSFQAGIGDTIMGAIPLLVSVMSGHSEGALRRYPPFGDRGDVREHKLLRKEDRAIIEQVLHQLRLGHLPVMMPEQVLGYYRREGVSRRAEIS